MKIPCRKLNSGHDPLFVKFNKMQGTKTSVYTFVDLNKSFDTVSREGINSALLLENRVTESRVGLSHSMTREA